MLNRNAIDFAFSQSIRGAKTNRFWNLNTFSNRYTARVIIMAMICNAQLLCFVKKQIQIVLISVCARIYS